MNQVEFQERLSRLEARKAAYNHALGLLQYDGDTVAPKETTDNRGQTMSVLAEDVYTLETGEEIQMLLKESKQQRMDEATARICELNTRALERNRKIPMDEYLAFQRLTNEASAVWHKAKVENDYRSFAPYIDKMVEALKRFAGYARPDLTPYNYLLDLYEPNMTTDVLDEFFGKLRENLKPLIKLVTESKPICEDALNVDFPIEAQKKLSEELMRVIGLDRGHVGIGETEHPYTTNFSCHDVRITTHYHEKAFASSMYSVIHEGGHALYESNVNPKYAYTVLGTGVSMAVHECQSRFFENILGRSRAFIGYIAPKLKELCPALQKYSEADLYRAVNAAKPSLIRTEADELTYCLHVMIRYELEKKLFSGEIAAKDLPKAWNEMYKEYLGISVPTDREGVLQDSHWSGGAFGYFPSYALGSAYGAQLLNELLKDVPAFEDISKGDFSRVNAWLKAHIWQHGSLYDPKPLMEKAFGSHTFDASYYVDYLNRKYRELYQ